MDTYCHIRRAEIGGRWLGGVVRRLMRGDGRATRFGQPPIAVRVLLWTVGVAIVGLLVILAFWLALVLVVGWVALNVANLAGQHERPKWEPTDPNDRRRHLFYDPLTHNHDPDPRYEGR